MTEAVIGLSLGTVGKHLVGLFGLLEFLLGFLVIRIAVRMEFHGELAIGFLDVVV